MANLLGECEEVDSPCYPHNTKGYAVLLRKLDSSGQLLDHYSFKVGLVKEELVRDCKGCKIIMGPEEVNDINKAAIALRKAFGKELRKSTNEEGWYSASNVDEVTKNFKKAIE